MRLRRLALTRYGKFTDRVLDFGETQAGTPDLHLIIGANEAGKSTAFDALLSLLFGIPTQTPYAFLHDYKSMEIGGLIEVGGRKLDLKRIKAAQNSLRTHAGEILPPGALGAALGGLTRETYREMFSLDEQSLKDGGEAILASKGELGSMLFAASSGLSGIANALEGVRKEAETLYKARAHSTRLREAIRRLDELKQAQAAIDVNVSQFESLRSRAETARLAHEAANAALTGVQRRNAEITRLRSALPLGARYRIDAALLEPVAHRQPPPEGWAAKAAALIIREAEMASALRQRRDEIAACEQHLATLVMEPQSLLLAEPLASLADRRVRFRAAALDLPRRLAEQRSAAKDVEREVTALGLDSAPDPDSLVLPAPISARIIELADRHPALAAAVQTTRAEEKDALERFNALEMEGPIALPPDDGVLDGMIARIAIEDNTGKRLRLREAIAVDKERRNGVSIAPFAGDAAMLAALAPPEPETVRRWSRALAEAAAHVKLASDRNHEAREKTARADAHAAALARAEGLADDSKLAALATAREIAWLNHRAALDTDDRHASAENYTAAAGAERATLVGNLARAGRLGEWRAEMRAADTLRLEARIAQELSDEAQSSMAAIRARIDSALDVCGINAGMEPDDFAHWLEQRSKVLALDARIAEQQAQAEAVDEMLAADSSALKGALAARGISAPHDAAIPSLLDAGRAALRTEAAARTAMALHAKAREEARRQKDSRTALREKAGLDLAQWMLDWRTALDRTWIGARKPGEAPSVTEVRATLTTLTDLRERLGDRSRFDHQVEAMQQDQNAFVAAVGVMAKEVGIPLDADDPAVTAIALDALLANAQEIAKNRASYLEKRDKARAALTGIEAENLMLEAERTTMHAFYGVSTTEALQLALSEGEKAESLRTAMAQVARELPGLLQQPDMTSALAALVSYDADSLSAESEALAIELRDKMAEAQNLHSDRREAQKAFDAVGADDQGAKLAEDRRTTLLEIEDIAMRYLKLRLGVAAMEAALKTYRDHHRSGMLTDAAARFRRITGGSFADLRTQSMDKGETLVGVRAEGGSLLAEAMSKGTRDQLFFALRMAGYMEFVQLREALPFVADDVMETFDDERSAATFEMLADVARHGQVIYFTHHDHLAPIARKIVGEGLRIIRLDAR